MIWLITTISLIEKKRHDLLVLASHMPDPWQVGPCGVCLLWFLHISNWKDLSEGLAERWFLGFVDAAAAVSGTKEIEVKGCCWFKVWACSIPVEAHAWICDDLCVCWLLHVLHRRAVCLWCWAFSLIQVSFGKTASPCFTISGMFC